MWSGVETLMRDAVGTVFPAAQLIVADEGRERLHLSVGAAGEATVFDLASLTKALATTTLVMRLGLPLAAVVELAAARATVRALLSHSSGLPGWKKLYADGVVDRDAVLAAVRATPLEYVPGTKSVYSDLGFILLGDAIAQHGGAGLDALFTREVTAHVGSALSFHPSPERCAPTEGELRGVVHDDNARHMGGVAGHAGLFGAARDVAVVVAALVRAWHGEATWLAPEVVRQFWCGAGVPGSTWALGWDRPAPHGSSAGERWPKDGVGHLAFTGCSIWIDPPRARWVILTSNRVYPTRANEKIRQLRPALHDAIQGTLSGGSAR